MQVFCSNCNTAHEVSQEQARITGRSVIHCKSCDKKIKLQFCPHCGSFYSITFANIKGGRYKYKCRKCMKDFAIEFAEERRDPVFIKPRVQPAPPAEREYIAPDVHFKAAQENAGSEEIKPVPVEKIEVASFISNSISSFSVNEIFSAAAGAFSAGRIAVSSAGVTFMLLLVWLFNTVETLYLGGGLAMHPFTGSLIALFPLAIIFSIYTVTAAVVSKITLDVIFHGRAPEWDKVIKFSLRSGPGIFTANVAILLTVSSLLILFGRIPLFGPVFFSLVFLPVYLISISIFMLCFIGLWFYPPISAHREGNMSGNLKSLALFIKKHNLGLLYMIPVIILVSLITFSAIFLIHTSAFSLTISLSQWLISGDGGGVFASIPASFVRASEATISGLGSGLFRQLSVNLGMTHHVAGFILGISMMIITIFLLAIAVSVTATVSSHIYIVMERGLTIDDRKKGGVFLILTLMLSVLLILKKLI